MPAEEAAGCTGVRERHKLYNSGNLLFVSSRDKTTVAQEITELLAEHYDFEIPFSLLTAEEYREDAHNLPAWWNEDMPRLDAMFSPLMLIAMRSPLSSKRWMFPTRCFT